MRTINVLVASALLGATIGLLFDEPSAAASNDTGVAPAQIASSCDRLFCESVTWLRMPVMRRTSTSKQPPAQHFATLHRPSWTSIERVLSSSDTALAAPSGKYGRNSSHGHDR